MNPSGIEAFGMLASGRDGTDGIETAVGVPLTAYYNASYLADLVLDSGEVEEWHDHGNDPPVYPFDQLVGTDRLNYEETGWDGQPELTAYDGAAHSLDNSTLQGFLATGSWALLLAMNVPAQSSTNRILFSNSYSPNQYLAIDYPSSSPPYCYWRRNGVTRQGAVARTVGRVVYLWRYDAVTGACLWEEYSSAGWHTLVSDTFTPGNIAPGNYVQLCNYAPGGTYQPKCSFRIIAFWGVTIPSGAQLRAGGEWIANGLGCPVT